MRWFQGSIPAAIAAAKRHRCVFVVVITGNDDQSTQLRSSWKADSVSNAARNCCVAIQVDAQSETCVQFSQIYPVVCIPSCFFIGENGIPLEVIAGGITAEELTQRINKVKLMHEQQIEGGATYTERDGQTPTSSTAVCQSQDDQSVNVVFSNCSSATSKESLSVPPEEDAASGHMTAGDDKSLSSEDGPQSEEPIDARVERLTKKLEERREQKKKAEEENELKKEVERRKMGKEMLDYKRKQEEDKTKRLLEERNREKAEEKAARERVKQQIALDRADRAARYAQSQQEAEAARLSALQSRAAEHEATQKERSAVARIQFRLPDGSSFTNQFSSETRLQEVRRFAAQEVGNRYGQFSLATMFPRREFTAEDLQRSLLELELVPSASIVLLPQSSRPSNTVVQSSAGGGVWAMLGSFLYPLLAVWRFLSSFLFRTPPPPGTAAASARAQNQHAANAHGASSEPQRDAVRKRVLEKRPEDFKKDGKIHRLRTQEDSEDDNNTWNGNSTQQM